MTACLLSHFVLLLNTKLSSEGKDGGQDLGFEMMELLTVLMEHKVMLYFQKHDRDTVIQGNVVTNIEDSRLLISEYML